MNPSKVDPLKKKRNELINGRRNLLQVYMNKDQHYITGVLHDAKIEGNDIILRLKGVRSPTQVDAKLYEVFSERSLLLSNIRIRLGKNVYKFLD